MKKIRFITDSTCDLPPNLVEKHRIGVVPVYVNYHNQTFADDGKELIREKYYDELPSIRPHPTSAAMSTGLAEEYILKADQEADHVIVITLPSSLSGVYNAMRLALQKLPPERYTLIDAGNTSMGLGWQVALAAEVAERTGDVEQVIGTLKRLRENVHVYCVLDTLEYLRRSGRVGWAAANVGALLQIKPVIHVSNGEVKNVGRVRTFKRALQELADRVRQHAPIDRLAILHANNASGAHEFAAMIQDITPPHSPTIFITPAIGTNIGPGGVGAAVVSQAWRNESDHAIGNGNTGQNS
ncbi:MAG: DegV family protein [bacterium]|nr:DegV family protein [bacterium]